MHNSALLKRASQSMGRFGIRSCEDDRGDDRFLGRCTNSKLEKPNA